MNSTEYKLTGFIVNPFANGILGFVRPYFQLNEKFYIADISNNNLIRKFVRINKPEKDDVLILRNKEIKMNKNDEALFAFAFSKHDILFGRFEDIADKLSQRMDELSFCPFIMDEVFQFLKIKNEYLELVNEVTTRMEPLNKEIANTWKKER